MTRAEAERRQPDQVLLRAVSGDIPNGGPLTNGLEAPADEPARSVLQMSALGTKDFVRLSRATSRGFDSRCSNCESLSDPSCVNDFSRPFDMSRAMGVCSLDSEASIVERSKGPLWIGPTRSSNSFPVSGAKCDALQLDARGIKTLP